MRLLAPKAWERMADMEKLHVGTADLTEENVRRLAELFATHSPATIRRVI